jgi:hypothetical protein
MNCLKPYSLYRKKIRYNRRKTLHTLGMLTAFFFASHVFAAHVDIEYSNKTYEEAIHSVVLQQLGSEERLPIISLGTINGLQLRFDELRPENDFYQYKFVHCSSQWEPSNLQMFDFIEGEPFGNVEHFEFSQNTYFQYTFYQLIFPQPSMKLKLSGNYLLVVYRNFDEEDIILTRRFMVVNEVFNIDGFVERSSMVHHRNTMQQINFKVNADNYEIPNPMLDIHAVILQNINWNTAIYGLKPRFINRGELNFNYDKETNFWAGNEFRFFDIRSLRNMSDGVKKKYFDNKNRPVAELFLDKSNVGLPYLQFIDYNGKFVLDNRDGGGRNPNTSSDYVMVQFRFSNPSGELDKPVYIFGELSDWELKDDFRMVYDPNLRLYYGELFLKQGYYSYWYVTPDETNQNSPNLSLTEGNHFQTENDYHVLVYHRNQFLRYDELLGSSRLSSAGIQRRD